MKSKSKVNLGDWHRSPWSCIDTLFTICHEELSQAPKFRETSQIQEISGNCTGNGT